MNQSGSDPELLSQVARVARLTARMTRGARTQSDVERIFISYRREDSGHAGRLYDWLQRSFPKGRLFMDVGTIQPGADFEDRIDEALSSAEVVLVLIGPRWLTDAAGHHRLDDPQDVVKREVASGLGREDILVLPVLLGGARMPSGDELPAELEDLARRTALDISDLRWDEGMERLSEVLRKVLGEPGDTATSGEMAELARMLVTVGNFLEDPDPEHDPGDFLIVGAGVGKNGEPDFAVEVMVQGEDAWCELASNVHTKDEVQVMNQILRLKDLGWTHPPEGANTKGWLRGLRLTRWWRDIRSNTMNGDFEDVNTAILETFLAVYGAPPQGVALGWSSPPRHHPTKRPDAAPQDGGQLVRAVWR